MLGGVSNPSFQNMIPELISQISPQDRSNGFNVPNMLNQLNAQNLSLPDNSGQGDVEGPVRVIEEDTFLPTTQNNPDAQSNQDAGYGQNPFGGLAQNMMDTMRGMMSDMMGSIGEGFPALGGGAGSEGAYANMSYSRVSFQMSASVVNAVSNANGSSVQASSFDFSFSFESFQAQVGIGGGQPGAAGNPLEGLGSFDEFFAKLDQMLGLGGSEEGEGAEAANATDPLAGINDEIMNAINEYFSPEATANRILDFALSGFPNSSFFEDGGDTEDSRGAFADFIGTAIQQGFDEALEILGPDISEDTKDHVDEIHDNVFSGLDSFVKNGNDDEVENPDQLNNYGQFPYQAASMEAYSFQMSYSYSQTTYSSYESGAGAGSGAENNAPTSEDAVLDTVA